jgi:hypothetical protein
MSARLTVTLQCDLNRDDRCEGIYQTRGGAAGVQEARKLAAVRHGWHQTTTGQGHTQDVCPSCWKHLEADYQARQGDEGEGAV